MTVNKYNSENSTPRSKISMIGIKPVIVQKAILPQIVAKKY